MELITNENKNLIDETILSINDDKACDLEASIYYLTKRVEKSLGQNRPEKNKKGLVVEFNSNIENLCEWATKHD